jgi:hypothetical protein
MRIRVLTPRHGNVIVRFMHETEVAQTPTDDELRAWDWNADLARRGAPASWLAAQTDRAVQTVYQYRSGQTRPSLDWLRAAWRLLRAS